VAARTRFLAELLRRIAPFVGVFLGVYLAASVGFYLLEAGRIGLLDSFYFGIASLSTVGYGDFVPTNPTAKLFTISLLFTQIFLGGYLFSVIVGIVSDESQKRLLGTLGTDLKQHTVVLGYGAVGRATVRELLLGKQQVAVVAERSEEVPNLRALATPDRLFATYGAPSDPAILERANVGSAHSVVVCTDDDTTTLIAALNVRNLAPSARIVVSVTRPELRTTLRAAGVTYVASPGDMGGRLCASAAFQPEVAHAIEDLSEAGDGADIREFLLTETTPLSRQRLPEAELLVRRETGCLLVGGARRLPTGEFETVLNPPDSFTFRPGDGVLVLGTNPNHERFRRWIGVPQGR
jgi:voltage-gated potassium channel